MANPKFKIFIGKNSQFYFHLTAANGEIILSSEGYIAKENAIAGINSVKVNASNDARYKRLIAKNGQHYFTLHAANEQIIGTSEMYVAAQGRDNGIESVKKNAPIALVE